MKSPFIIMTMLDDALFTRAEYKHEVERSRARSREYPEHLVPIPQDYGLPAALVRLQPLALLRSRKFICTVFDAGGGVIRLTINRAELELTAGNVCQYKAGITWDELQQLKREAGYGDKCAVELFPADVDVVNIANMRHLWVLPEPPAFAWRDRRPRQPEEGP